MKSLVILAAAEGEEHNPLLPLWEEVAISLVVFGLLFFAVKKFVVPNFEKTFAERSQAIEGGIAAAESKQAEADAKSDDGCGGGPGGGTKPSDHGALHQRPPFWHAGALPRDRTGRARPESGCRMALRKTASGSSALVLALVWDGTEHRGSVWKGRWS